MPEPILVANEEIEELKASLLKSEEEKKELQARLEKVSQENDNLRSENTCKSQFIERNNKRLKIEKENKLDIQDCLRGANEELDVRKEEKNAAIEEAYMWKQLWAKSASSEKKIKKEFEDLKKQLQEMVDKYEGQVRNERQQKEEIEELHSKHLDALKAKMEASSELKNYIDYQEKIYNDLKDETIYWEERFMVLLGQLKNQEIYKELEDKGKHWKYCFSKLAMLANQAIIKIPKHLREIDAVMHPLNTPIKVYKFVEYCKYLVEELEEKIGCPFEKDD